MREQERLPGPSQQEAVGKDATGEVRVFSPASELVEPGLPEGPAGSPAGDWPGQPLRLRPEEEQEGQQIRQQQWEAAGKRDELHGVEFVPRGSH